ncbi:MazG family protein [Bifidobacterium gallicum]
MNESRDPHSTHPQNPSQLSPQPPQPPQPPQRSNQPGEPVSTYQLPGGLQHCSKLQPVLDAPTALERVRQIVRILHEPGGCPWDGEQTNRSLIKPLLEETYEYIDAVETDDRDNMREELGDMLLQSIFQAQICSEDSADPFTLDEVCDRLVDKLITRHPNVFQDDTANSNENQALQEAIDADTTLQLWERMKQQEKQRTSVLDGIAQAQGALPRSAKVAARIRKSAQPQRFDEAFHLNTENETEQLADELLDLVRRADASGIDIECALRNRLRQVEQAVRTIEQDSSEQ